MVAAVGLLAPGPEPLIAAPCRAKYTWSAPSTICKVRAAWRGDERLEPWTQQTNTAAADTHEETMPMTASARRMGQAWGRPGLVSMTTTTASVVRAAPHRPPRADVFSLSVRSAQEYPLTFSTRALVGAASRRPPRLQSFLVGPIGAALANGRGAAAQFLKPTLVR